MGEGDKAEGGLLGELLAGLEQCSGSKFEAVKMIATKNSVWCDLESTLWGSIKVTYEFTHRKVFPTKTFLT